METGQDERKQQEAKKRRDLLILGAGLLVAVSVFKGVGKGWMMSDEDKYSYSRGYAEYLSYKKTTDDVFEKDLAADFAGRQKPPYTDAFKAGARDAYDGKDFAISRVDAVEAAGKVTLRYGIVR